MRSTLKRKSIYILTAAAAICLGGAVAGLSGNALTAFADEQGTYYAFVNVGASNEGKEADVALGLEEKGAQAVTAGTVTTGDTLFGSYSVNASYNLSVEAGTYQVAVAIIAESGTAVSVGGQSVNVGSTEGKQVVSTTATATGTLAVSVTGKLCGILVADENSKILMGVDYTEGQMVSYGALLSDELENATGYYSNGETQELAIEYEGIVASTGVNVNFTTLDVSGKVEGTNLTVTRYVTTMPDDLVYFINCGSFNVDGYYADTADSYYHYNQTLFDYYGKSLINYGTPDQVSNSADKWGCYTGSLYTAPGDSTFPYNSLRWTGDSSADSGAKGVTDMGYYFTDLEKNAQYRFYIGTLSHWHARTVKITFNEKVVGADTLRINASKGYTVYENVTADDDGRVNLHLEGGGTNEPCINFIAVQKMSVEIKAAPSALEVPNIIGMDEHSMLITSGVQEGAKIQLYNAARPNELLYEEKVDAEKLVAGEDGATSYTLDWGEQFTDISRFCIVQITNGGVSEARTVSITDIDGFGVTLSTEGYTTKPVTLNVTAHANSGIVSWSYQAGEYGERFVFGLDKPATMHESFTVKENGEYIIIVTSGLGVTYSDTVVVDKIDPVSPVITITPSKEGWAKGAYNVSLSVKGTAPVAEYKLYKDGAQIAASETAPATVTFTEEGEYLVYVKNEAGLSATNTVSVSKNPTVTSVTSSYANRTLTYAFGETAYYSIASITAYHITDRGTTRMTIASNNTMDVYDAGTYVVSVTTTNGTVEMFSITVTEDNLSNKVKPVIGDEGENNGTASTETPENGENKTTVVREPISATQLGVGLGVGIGGIVIAAAAIIVTIVLVKKKN